MSKPRLTDAVLRGIYLACDVAEGAIFDRPEGDIEEARSNRADMDDVRRASRWVNQMIGRRAAEKGVRFHDIAWRS